MLAFVCVTFAQQEQHQYDVSPEGFIPCATMQADADLRAKNPDMGTLEDFEEWLQRQMFEQHDKIEAIKRGGVMTIPVIVHIIHNGENVNQGPNISAAQVQSQIDVLNEDFRRMLGTPGHNEHPDGADAQIEFCLALFHPDGHLLPEPGINRVNGGQDEYSRADMDNNIKPTTIWDTEQYFNMWTCELNEGSTTGTVLGYAQFPSNSGLSGLNTIGGSALTDGIVLHHTAFGRLTGSTLSPHNRGRSATHEAGHFFGLRHTWGDGDCSADDFCADTPTSQGAHFGCAPSTTCGSVDMIENFMDYSNDICSNVYTNCQVGRMHTVLAVSPRRANLINSTVCTPPTVAPTANFTFDNPVSCGGQVQFMDASTDIPTNWFWNFGNGQTSTERDPIATFTTSGTYTITLVVNNPLGSSQTTQTVTINVSASPVIDAGPDLQICFGTDVQLTVTSDIPVDFEWNPNVGLSDPTSNNPILTPSSSRVYFITGTTPEGCATTDTLSVQVLPQPSTFVTPGAVTINAGASASLTAIGANSYEWFPKTWIDDPFSATPTVSPPVSQWYTVRGMNNDGCTKDAYVLVTVPGTTSLDKIFSNIAEVDYPYPNPAYQHVNFHANFKQTGDLNIALYDIRGKQIDQIFSGRVHEGDFEHQWERELSIATGIYFVIWEMNGVKLTQKVQLN